MADRRLQVFHAVAKYLSFTRAAEALFMSQPAVTFQVRQLEAQYGIRLFERRHGGIALTPAGELVWSYAERILALGDELDTRLGEATGEMRGTLVLGATATVAECLLPPVLGEFTALHPRVRPRLIVANSERIAAEVAGHTFELGLIEAPAKLPGLTGEALGDDELAVICAPDHPLAELPQVGAGTLADYEYLTREPGSATREAAEAYFRACRVAVEELKTQMELGSPAALKGAVMAVLGVAIVPRAAVARETAAGSLVAIPLAPPLRCSLHLVLPEDRFRSRLLTTFVQFARQRLRETAA